MKTKKNKATVKEAETYIKLWEALHRNLEKDNFAKQEQGTYADGYREALINYFDSLNK